MEPAIIAGQVIGKMTEKKVLPDLAPKSLEASSSDVGILSNPAYIGKIICGSHIYVRPIITAKMP